MTHRRRALLLGGLALVLGGLAASNVAGREAALQRRIGALVDVVVAREPIAAGAPVRRAALAVRRVPRRFAPDGAITAPDQVVGLRAAVDIAAGTDLAAGLVGDGAAGPPGPPIRRGERVAEVVALGSPQLIAPGSRVDVLVTPEPGANDPGHAVLALEDVEVLASAPAGGDGTGGGADGDSGSADGSTRGGGSGSGGGAADPSPGARVAASLRVTLRQAVYLAAAQDFARELRLLPRAPGDRRHGRAGLSAGPDLP